MGDPGSWKDPMHSHQQCCIRSSLTLLNHNLCKCHTFDSSKCINHNVIIDCSYKMYYGYPSSAPTKNERDKTKGH